MSSLRVLSGLLDGSTAALPRVAFEVVDVRDVAAAHLLAMTVPAAAGERFIVTGELLWFADIAEIFRAHLGSAAENVTSAALPDEVLLALAESNPELRSIVPLLGRELRHASTKARDQLGWQPRPAVETIVAAGRSILALRDEA